MLVDRILIVGYNSLEEARAKGLISSDPASLCVWYNPGHRFELSVVFIPFGKQLVNAFITPRIQYIEWPFPKNIRGVRRVYTAAILLFRAVFFSAKLIRTERLQVMRANGPHIPTLIAFLLRRVIRIPTVIFIEAFWEKLLPSQAYMPQWLKRILPLWYKWIVYRSFDVYCGTPSVDPQYFVDKGMPRNRVSDWIHELDLEALVAEADRVHLPSSISDLPRPRLVAVGRLHPEKHPEDLVRMLVLIKPTFHNVRLILVGDGEERERLVSLAQDLGVGENLVITGTLAQVEGLAVVSQSDVYVAPMQGNALVEAMAVGIPIVAYDHAWHRNLISHEVTGVLTPYRDVDAMAHAVISFLNEYPKAQVFGLAAKRDALNRFGRDAVAQRLCKPFYDAWNIAKN